MAHARCLAHRARRVARARHLHARLADHRGIPDGAMEHDATALRHRDGCVGHSGRGEAVIREVGHEYSPPTQGPLPAWWGGSRLGQVQGVLHVGRASASEEARWVQGARHGGARVRGQG